MNLEEHYINLVDDAVDWCGEDDLLTAPPPPPPPPKPSSEFKTAEEIMNITRAMC